MGDERQPRDPDWDAVPPQLAALDGKRVTITGFRPGQRRRSSDIATERDAPQAPDGTRARRPMFPLARSATLLRARRQRRERPAFIRSLVKEAIVPWNSMAPELLPAGVASTIIESAGQESVVLQLANTVVMPERTMSIPTVSVVPKAEFVAVES